MNDEAKNEPLVENEPVGEAAGSEAPTPKNQSRKWLFVGLGVVLVMIVAGVVWGFTASNKETAVWEDAQQAAENGDWATVEELTTTQLAIQPAFVQKHAAEALGLRGIAHYHLGESDAALADLNEALAQDELLMDLYAYRAMLLLDDDPDLAAADAKTAVASDLLPPYLQTQMNLILVDKSDVAAVEAILNEADRLSDEQLGQLYATLLNNYLSVEDTAAQSEILTTVLSQELDLSPQQEALLALNAAKLAQAAGDDLTAIAQATYALTLADELDDADQAELHSMLALLYLDQGDVVSAIAQAEQADEADALVHALQSWHAYELFDEETAVSEAETALESADEASLAAQIAHRTLGAVATWQGDFNQALTALDAALDINPHDIQARALRVYNLYEMTKIDEAQSNVDFLVDNAPENPASLWAQAEAAMSVGDHELANVLLNQAIVQDATRPEYFTSRSYSYRLTKDKDRELEDLEQALILNPDFGLAIALKAAWQLSQNEIDDFEEITLELVEKYPDWYGPARMLANYYAFEEDNQEEALTWIAKAIDLNPDAISNYILRGDILADMEDYEAARTDYEYALSLDPGSPNAKSGLAFLATINEEWEQAVELTEEILAEYPRSLTSQTRLASAYMDNGENEKAWTLIKNALAQDSLQPRVLVLHAFLFVEQELPRQALGELEKALVSDPNYAYAHAFKAGLLLQLGDADGAVQSAQKAIELDPLLAEPHRTLFLHAVNNNDREEAETQFDLWLEKLDPRDVSAENISFYQLMLNQHENVITTVTDALAEEPDLENAAAADLYYNRALAYLNSDDEEAGQADLQQVVELSDNINLIADAEALLADSKQVTRVEDGRLQFSNESFGYTVTYADWWNKIPSENIQQDLDLVLAYETDSDFGLAYTDLLLNDLAVTPAEVAASFKEELTGSPTVNFISSELVNLPNANAVIIRYEVLRDPVFQGKVYIFIQDNKLVQLFLEASGDAFAELEPELDAMALSFTFLP